MQGKRKTVMLMRPADLRFTEIPIKRETDLGLECDKVEGISWRFFKSGPAWSGDKSVKFLAAEGTPLISYIQADKKEATCAIPEFLNMAWGEGYYKKLPKELRDMLDGRDTHRWGATVTVKPIIPAKEFGLNQVMADAILRESDIGMLEDFGKSTPKRDKIKDFARWIIPVALGFFIGIVVNQKGWF
jgi:hypothetical protein